MPPRRAPAARDGALLTAAQARALVDYNRRVFDRFVRRVRRLPWRAVRRRREIGHQSLFDTLVHILNVQEVWLAHAVEGRGTEADLAPLFRDEGRHPTDWRGFARYRRRVEHAVERTVGRLDARRLAEEVRVFWMPGRYRVSDALWQTTFEQAHHLGEIIGALWQDDVPPPEMTWIRVTRPRGR